jgi:hypothetical protein
MGLRRAACTDTVKTASGSFFKPFSLTAQIARGVLFTRNAGPAHGAAAAPMRIKESIFFDLVSRFQA